MKYNIVAVRFKKLMETSLQSKHYIIYSEMHVLLLIFSIFVNEKWKWIIQINLYYWQQYF